MARKHGMRIIAALFAAAVAAFLLSGLFLPETTPPVPKRITGTRAPEPPSPASPQTQAQADPDTSASPAPAAPRGPKIGEIVAPARRDVTPSTLTQTAHSTGPLVRVEGVAPSPKTSRPRKREETLHRVVAVDGGHLRAGKQVFTLSRISALALDETCASPEGAAWPCGMAARTALRRLIRGRAVTCRRTDKPDEEAGETPEPGDVSQVTYLCEVGGQDLGEWMLRQGWAAPASDGDEEGSSLVSAARDAGLGRWRQTGLPTVSDDSGEETASADDPFDELVERLELAPEALQPDFAAPDTDDGDTPTDSFFASGNPASDGATTPLRPALR